MNDRERWICIIFSFLTAITAGLAFSLINSNASDESGFIVMYGTLIYSYMLARDTIRRCNINQGSKK